jgi:hypothetical protein
MCSAVFSAVETSFKSDHKHWLDRDQMKGRERGGLGIEGEDLKHKRREISIK